MNDLETSGRPKDIPAANRHPESNADVCIESIASECFGSRLLDSTRVDAPGTLILRMPRDSVVDASLEPGTDTLVWIQSEHGCQETSTFIHCQLIERSRPCRPQDRLSAFTNFRS